MLWAQTVNYTERISLNFITFLLLSDDSVDVTSEPDDQDISVAAASHNPNKGQLEVQLGGAVTLQCPQGKNLNINAELQILHITTSAICKMENYYNFLLHHKANLHNLARILKILYLPDNFTRFRDIWKITGELPQLSS